MKQQSDTGSATTPCSAPTPTLRDVLIVLAADILTTREMPSEYACDWHFSKSTTVRDKAKVIGHARRSREQCRKWAIKLRAIADNLPNANNAGSKPAHQS